MPSSLILQLPAVFGAGLLASLSPCVYPVIPITLGYLGSQGLEQKKQRVLLYGLGQILALTSLGVFAVSAGETLGFTSQSAWVNRAVGILLLLMGVLSLYGRLPGFLSRFNGKIPKFERVKGGLLGAFLLGLGSALLTSPCTTPVLSGVLAVMASTGALLKGVALMLAYSIGFSLLVIVLGLGLIKVQKVPRSGRWMLWVHSLSACLLMVAGIYYMAKSWGYFE